MEIGVKETAQLFNVSEKTIYRWLKENKIPCYKINDQYRFNRYELLEWASSKQISIAPEIFNDKETDANSVTQIYDALKKGGIHYRVGGKEKKEVLQSVVELMPLPNEVNRKFLLQVLLARESLGSTAIGGGIAIPHVRNPIVMHIPQPMITLCFLENPIDFDSLDGVMVHTLFTILSPTIKAHLNLISRLCYSLKQPNFFRILSEKGLREDILKEIQLIEQSIINKKNTDNKGADVHL